MYCPECGYAADEAKFCPECGSDLTTAGEALRRRASRPAGGSPAKAQRTRPARSAAGRSAEPAPSGGSRATSLRVWLSLAAIAAVVVAIVFAVGGGSSGDPAPAAAAAELVAADTSGSYSELVDRANGLYDQGIEAFNRNDAAGGEAYFKAASHVYRAAWEQQPGDPNVGTDLAVALFYMRHHDEGLKQIEAVIKQNPEFQAAHLNKGIFLQTEAREASDNAAAADYLAEAKVAFRKALSIDPASDAGKHAAEALQSL